MLSLILVVGLGSSNMGNLHCISLLLYQGDQLLELSEGRRESLETEGTPSSLNMDNDLFHLYTIGSDSQRHLGYACKEFLADFENEAEQSKAEEIEEDGDSSSARVQWSDDQPSSSSNNTAADHPPAVAKATTSVVSVGLEAEETTAGPSNINSPRILVTPLAVQEENPQIATETTQLLDVDIQEDGEYLIRPYLEPGEKLKFRYNCERVVGLDKRAGIFLIGEQALYVIENYSVDEEAGCIKEKGDEGEVSVIDRALGVQLDSASSLAEAGRQPSANWSETVAAVVAGGRAWAYSSGAWGKEKVSCKQCQIL